MRVSAIETLVFQDNPMNAYRTTELRHAAAAPRDRALGHALLTEVRIARAAVLCGFAGAVLVQASLLALAARLLLDLDSALLPNLAISTCVLAFGALLMAGGKSLGDQAPLAA
jgi:hypothetical protein